MVLLWFPRKHSEILPDKTLKISVKSCAPRLAVNDKFTLTENGKLLARTIFTPYVRKICQCLLYCLITK